MMNTRLLSVLMWKHAVVRLRRFIHTAVDCVSPLMFFLFIFAFKDKLRPEVRMSDLKNPVGNTDVIALEEINPPPYWIMYYPESTLTNSLMEDVGAKLDLKRLDANSDRSEKGYWPLANDSRLADYAADMQIIEAIVIFHGMSGETWPEKLNYTIRMKGDFFTESYESMDDTPGPHRMFGFKYGTFMGIQWAIDTSYIKLLTGNEVPQRVSLQEFPYYHSDTDSDTVQICKFLTVLCWLSLMLTFVFLMCRLLQERTSGIQELMKMVGVSLNTLGLSHFLNVLPCGLVFAIGGAILFTTTSNPLIPKTNGFWLFLMLLLYFNTIVALAFVCSYISKGTQYAATLSVLAYVALWMPTRILSEKNLPYLTTLATGFFPHMPMSWFWKELSTLEVYGRGVNFSNMVKAHTYNTPCILTSYFFMLLQAAIFYFLAWYLSLVRPGNYGQALPWNFLFKRQYWSKNEVKPDSEAEEEDPMTQDPRYFEPAPAHAVPGIKIVNVSKVYPKHRALRNVSMEVYKGEITVLLGHNGAGKTTLMSIITGMTSATEGKVYVNGKDTVTQKKELRKILGLCPQHNLYFEDLTVQQHIMFFSLLKGGTYQEAKMSSQKLAERLALSDKLGALTTELSGGMKRRAQMAYALAGGADVLVLDEPTSGLDVETRRELWDLLLSLRGDRTVLLTTHFMEEADALGDRVAALHNGVLKSFATTMHLKKAVGTGYRLSFTTIGTPKEEEITKVVTSHVSDASLKEQTINSISYNLPAAQSDKFPALFSALEEKRSKLGLDSIGVGVSTLDEVFLKLCSDIDTTLSEDEVDTAREPETPPKKVTGFLLYRRQLFVLLKRHVKYALHKKWSFLALQVVIPITMIFLMTHMMNNRPEPPMKAMAMNLGAFNDRQDNRVLYDVNSPDVIQADVDKLHKMYPEVTFEKTHDVANTILGIGKKDTLEYNKYLVGVEVNETDAKALYTTTVRHAAPVALNLLSNMYAAHYISWSDGNTITTMNDPISRELDFKQPKQAKDLMTAISWGICITFIILSTNINNISLPCKERQTGSRHIHVMSGCPAELHWLATLSFHMALCVLALILPTVMAALIIEKDHTIDQPDLLGAFVIVLLLGSLSFFALSYLISFNFSERSTSIILVACIIIFGVLTPFMKAAQEVYEETSGVMYHVLWAIGYITPPHIMVTTAINCISVGLQNANCKLARHNCPELFTPEFDTQKCCAGENVECYFCFKDDSPGKGMVIMLVQFLLMMIMVFLTQRGVFNGLVDKVMNARYQPKQPVQQDEHVRAEKAYVSKAITLPPKQIPDAMLADDLHKNYPPYIPFIKKSVNAVKGVSFSVKKGECFGLLGVNGAGKSTCFKMLTAEETATKGNIFGNGYHLRRGNSQYLQTLGYCPQFFGLDMFQTGEENLAMVLTLRGFDKQRVKEEVANWIQIVGLEKYARRKVEGYSGGCVRRLGAAAALCGSADLALLDEPSSGVDVAARRRLWTALRRALRHQRAVVITSHSMDEMEALCSRIAILSGGQVRALGTAAALRAAHAQGHAVVFKVTHAQPADEVDGAKSQVNKLKGKLQETFNCTLKDEHKTMLHYHINETMRYSKLFAELESLRTQFPYLIEDYSVTETTLEEVFLSFAKEHQSEQQSV